MEAFLTEQADFILFFYGLAFILLGITCFAITQHAIRIQSWLFLGLFGLVHGASEWLDLSALVIGDTPQFAVLRTAVMTVSYLLLLEFARRELRRLSFWVPGAWIHGLLIGLVVGSAVTQGLNEANALARYAIGLVGAWATSLVFAMHAKSFVGTSKWLAVMAAVSLSLYGVAAGAIVPAAPFWPADALDQEWFLAATGVPIQLVRGVLACCIAMAIWGIWGQKLIDEVSSVRYTRFLRKQFVATVAILLAILFFGWGLTEYFGLVHKQNLKEETRGDLDLLASSLSGITAPIDAVVKSLAGSPTVRSALSGGAGARTAEIASVLSLDVAASGAQNGYILDTSGALVATSGRADLPDGDRAFASYFEPAISGKAERHFIFDAASKKTVYSTSYPVRAEDGDVIGVAVLTLSLSGLKNKLEAFKRPFFLVDPQGVIALSNRPETVQRAIWLSTAAPQTRPPQTLPLTEAPPLLETEIADGSWATVDGAPMYVRRCTVAHTDWSIVIFVPIEGIFASRVLGIAITLLTTIMVLIYVIARQRAVHDHVQMDRRLELEELARILDHKATTDPLTGLSNRLKFDEALAKEIRRSRRFDTPLSLILYDIDNFKQINDSFGHQVGDDVLIKLSRHVAERMRATDLLARWGGEEFAILVPHPDGASAARFANILRAAIEVVDFDDVGTVTCSFGVAQLSAGESADGLVQRVDCALYRAKLSGRNRVELAEAPAGASTGVGSAA